jgi:hypothetical protein
MHFAPDGLSRVDLRPQTFFLQRETRERDDQNQTGSKKVL